MAMHSVIIMMKSSINIKPNQQTSQIRLSHRKKIITHHNTKMDNIESCINKIIDERNKAQSESEYWKAEADRWREVALLQDAQIETIIAKLEHRMRKIESGIRELQ